MAAIQINSVCQFYRALYFSVSPKCVGVSCTIPFPVLVFNVLCTDTAFVLASSFINSINVLLRSMEEDINCNCN